MSKNKLLRLIKNKIWKHQTAKNITLDILDQFGSLPDFLIVGIEKCGTTTLYNYMIQHPKIKQSLQKEPHYFNRHYRSDLKRYRSYFPPIGKTIDATPVNYRDQKLIQRIKKHLPDKKFIFILRDPVKRTVSAWNMNYQNGWDKRTLEDVIRHETKPEIPDGYLAQSRYVNRLDLWYSFFPDKTQTYIMKLENLKKYPHDEMRKLYNFLGLENYITPRLAVHNKGNYTVKPKPETISYLKNYFKTYNQQLLEKYGIVYT